MAQGKNFSKTKQSKTELSDWEQSDGSWVAFRGLNQSEQRMQLTVTPIRHKKVKLSKNVNPDWALSNDELSELKSDKIKFFFYIIFQGFKLFFLNCCPHFRGPMEEYIKPQDGIISLNSLELHFVHLCFTKAVLFLSGCLSVRDCVLRGFLCVNEKVVKAIKENILKI